MSSTSQQAIERQVSSVPYSLWDFFLATQPGVQQHTHFHLTSVTLQWVEQWSLQKNKSKNESKLLFHLLWDVNGALLTGLFLSSSKKRPYLPQSPRPIFLWANLSWLNLRRPPIHLNDEEPVIGLQPFNCGGFCKPLALEIQVMVIPGDFMKKV